MKALGAIASTLDKGPSHAGCQLTHCVLLMPRGVWPWEQGWDTASHNLVGNALIFHFLFLPLFFFFFLIPLKELDLECWVVFL